MPEAASKGVLGIREPARRLMFRLIDTGLKAWLDANAPGLAEGYGSALGLFTSGLGAQLTWTL